MAFMKRSYEEIQENILTQITRGVVNEKYTYDVNRSKYKLGNTPVKEIVKVEGILNGSGYTFSKGEDYKLSGDMLEWAVDGDKPDDGTTFFVNYVFIGPTGITDVNPGSVVRTIVGAASREIEYLYEQLNQVYLAGFIDTASGSALDLVVSILGVQRKPAEQASGMVTFGRNTDPGEISVDHETHLHDGKTAYELKSTPVKNIVKIEGAVGGNPYSFEQGVDYVLTGNRVEWQTEGKKPDLNSLFYVDYVAYEQIKIPAGMRASTYARRPEDTKVFVTTEERSLEKTPEGRWEADVPVRASLAGKAGNVNAGALIVMPQPLVGVEYAINRGDILTGMDAETDDDLRERAKHALEVAGKATLVSLESAVRGVDGVTSVLIEDMPDEVLGVVKIIAFGGETSEIERVISDTRAAGIRVEFSRPQPVHLDTTVTLTMMRGATPSKVEKDVEAKIRGYLSSLDIGEDVVYSRIVRAVLDVEGVYDITEITIKAYRREGGEVITSTRENIELRSEEMAVARTINVLVVPLERGRG
jgi:uncharacterized phage protein gp47/JayE